MKSILTNVAIFAAGVVTGGFVVWNYIKPKLEEAIEKTMAASEQNECDTEPKEEVSEQLSFDDYSKVLDEAGYNAGMPKDDDQKPYVIRPDQFGDLDYDEIEYTLYSDGILADDVGEMVNDADIERCIGRENLERIGEYEKDVVYVRNDKQGTDYIICKDLDTYESVVSYEPFAPET